eukprot:CAMPEP_0201523302 /NCGR_PEP_ID=MMETSP0161_2-20130828/19310_1 /ASSEMBLY_ACC=CAM_ASM_000251 /TAXON_ID=180227 /ORGANISM="Neoparamoeba aestuarina, Strain SoJaBio B1-5/56/2" /LENGTH=103 /DNA_ID=CAMNT_0047922373 /DNA_START=140 /DNA_END=447 /DNA_ORIENTATION=+
MRAKGVPVSSPPEESHVRLWWSIWSKGTCFAQRLHFKVGITPSPPPPLSPPRAFSSTFPSFSKLSRGEGAGIEEGKMVGGGEEGTGGEVERGEEEEEEEEEVG